MNKKTKKPEKPYEKIRWEALKNIKREQDRSVLFSCFTATPIFEDKYYPYIVSKPEYLDIYKTWVLDRSPFPMPKDEKIYFLIQNIIVGIDNTQADGARLKINKPILFLLLDMVNPFIDGLLVKASRYYNTKDIPAKAIINSAVIAMTVCKPESVAILGYPGFIPAFCSAFKACLPGEIGVKHQKLPKEDDAFATVFEKEWVKLYPYSDALYGFDVMPVSSPDDMFRYLRLPFENRKFKKLRRSKIYYETINYVAAMATFKAVPDARVKQYFKSELNALFEPLVESDINRVIKNRQFGYSLYEINELKEGLKKDLEKITNNFDFFYASTKNLDKGKISPFGNSFFPMRGVLVRPGHIFSSKEYPFTDYVAEKFRQKTKTYFAPEILNEDYVSLDMEVGGDSYGGNDRKDKLADIINKDGLPISKMASSYDAKDEDGNPVGWTIKTFAGLTGRTMKTLRDWDRRGFLKPKRYDIYSRIHRKKIWYRAYTHDDIQTAKNVAEQMRRRMRHKD